jgi:hypothetical protein
MNEDKGIMQYDSILPADFDGVFRFTNWSDEEFVGVWGKKEYHFPAQSTSPMIIPEHSPVEVQNIRKKFAKDLAEREFFKSQSYNGLISQERGPNGEAIRQSFQLAGTYSLETLTPFIQKCLEPLEITSAVVTTAPSIATEDKLSRNEEGQLNTEAIDRKTSLKNKALQA